MSKLGKKLEMRPVGCREFGRGRFRLGQFGLRELLLGILVFALLLGNVVTSVRLRNVTAQRDALRLQVGYLQPTGPGEVAAVRVPFDEPLAWKFLVRIPEKGRFRLAYSTFWPADLAQPKWVGAQALTAGECTVLVRIFSDPRDKVWKLTTVVRNQAATLRSSAVLDERQTQLFRTSSDTVNLGIGQETKIVAADQRLRILDQRWIGGEGGMLLYGARPPEDPIDGVFFEIQPDAGALN